MTRKLGPLAALPLLIATFAVGCGGSDNTSDSSSTQTGAATTGTTTSDVSGEAGKQLDAAVAACKKSVDENAQITADLKDDVKTICDKVRSNDPAEIQQATRDVCVKIVESSVPAGDVRNRAKAACQSAGG
ncbi:MAG: hypothetical protein JWM73_1756 [Solirubrobacterales bacterium]|nr:hypothetical protein [Solirubrobacterales bacterium]